MLCYYVPTSYFPVSDVPADLCSHLVYSFGQITSTGIVPVRQSDLQRYRVLVGLKKKNPKLKVLLSLQKDFPSVVDAGTTVMENFSSSAVKFLTSNGFDGVDLDWEFPSWKQRDSYAAFIQIFNADLKKAGLLLSAALPNNPYSFKTGFDPGTLTREMDFMTVMAYDFHLYLAGRDNRTGYNSPLFTPKGESKFLSTAAMVEYYKQVGISASKLLMGIPSYGRSWKLANASQHGLHAPATGKGDPSPYRHFKGLYLYPDVCMARQLGAAEVFDKENVASYLYTKNKDWVAFDSQDTVLAKVNFMKKLKLAGVGIWALHLDDVTGVCKAGPLPLLNEIKKALQNYSNSTLADSWKY